MTGIEFFGFVAVTVMVVAYALEARAAGFVLLFALACLAAAIYAALIQSWPFASVEAVWSAVALYRWRQRRSQRMASNERVSWGVRSTLLIADDETQRIATATAQKRYGDTRGLTKVLELSDPAGSYFAMLGEDGEASRIGDGGFFVARTDGRVVLLGSGNLVEVLYRRFGSPFAGSLSEAEIVAEAVKLQLNTKRPNEDW